MVGGDLEGMVRLKISRRLLAMSSAAETSHNILPHSNNEKSARLLPAYSPFGPPAYVAAF